MIFSDDSGKASKKDFTGSFDAGSGTDISTDLINKGVQMILPVAGPQTGDVAGVIASSGKKGDVFTFGVDVDQSKVYNSDYFLGSAIKGIYVSNSYALNVLSKLKEGKQRSKFPKFSMKLADINNKTEDSRAFREFTKSLKADLKKSKIYTDDDINVMLKPTGFAPSASMSKLTTNSQNIYNSALDFVKGGNVQAALTHEIKEDKTESDKAIRELNNVAWKAFYNFGGFMEVASVKK